MGSEPASTAVDEAGGSGTATQSPGPADSGTLTTPAGPISWSLGPDGTLTATGNGQELVITTAQSADGAAQHQAVVSQLGQEPYLTTQSRQDDTQRAVSLSLAAGSSQLTVSITGIDPTVSSGTGTLSGSWQGSAVNWAGPVDLTTNPLVTPLPAWPPGAFADQLAALAFFGPLAEAQFTSSPLTSPPAPPVSDDAVVQFWKSVLKALAWAGSAVVCGAAGAGAVASGGTLTPLAVGMCALGEADASLASDLIDQWESEVQPTSPPLPPVPPEPVVLPERQVGQDDPPPPGGQFPGDPIPPDPLPPEPDPEPPPPPEWPPPEDPDPPGSGPGDSPPGGVGDPGGPGGWDPGGGAGGGGPGIDDTRGGSPD